MKNIVLIIYMIAGIVLLLFGAVMHCTTYRDRDLIKAYLLAVMGVQLIRAAVTGLS